MRVASDLAQRRLLVPLLGESTLGRGKHVIAGYRLAPTPATSSRRYRWLRHEPTITFQSLLKLASHRITLKHRNSTEDEKPEEPAVATQSQPRPPNHALPIHEPPEAVRVTGVLIALAAALALVAIAFALPAAKSKPHDVPIGAVGPQAATGQLADVLERSAPGAFAVTIYPNDAELRTAIRDRDVYGGLSFGQPSTALLIATGGSPAVAQLLSQVANGMAQQTGTAVHIEDLAPPPGGDQRGAGLAAAALPVTLAGLLPAIVLTLVIPLGVWARFAATAVFSGLAGVTIATVLRFVLGSIDENFWAVAGGLTLGAMAVGLFVLGLASLFGRVGLALGALLALLVGNPLSGMASAPEMLPAGWGAFGQFLPQGANATLLRSIAFFDGAGAGTAIAVLICWAVVGSLIIVIAAQRRQVQTFRGAGAPERRAGTPVVHEPDSPQTRVPVASFRSRWTGVAHPSAS